MAPEPWKVMIGLSVLLVIVGAVLHFGITQPGQLAGVALFLVIFLLLTYGGYQFGKQIGRRKFD